MFLILAMTDLKHPPFHPVGFSMSSQGSERSEEGATESLEAVAPVLVVKPKSETTRRCCQTV